MARTKKKAINYPGNCPTGAREIVNAKAMVTVGPAHRAWTEALPLDVVAGHFFRLDPPEGVDPSVLARALREAGAAAVKVLPRAVDKAVAEAAHAAPAAESARQVVAELVAKSKVADKPSLEKMVDAALSEAGL